MIAIILSALAAVLAARYLWSRWRRLSILKDLGIPGPEPSMWNGNFAELTDKGFSPFLEENSKKYGSVWGYYEGPQPVIVTSDINIIKQFAIKQFSNYYNRKPEPVSLLSGAQNVLTAEDMQDWKRMRAIINPSFTALRMKEMSPLVNQSVKNLVDLFEEKCKEGEPFNIYAYFQRMTVEVIASCGFGLEINSVKDPSSVFLKQCRQFFQNSGQLSFLSKGVMLLMTSLPFMGRLKFLQKAFPNHEVNEWFMATCKEVIAARMGQETGRMDFIKLMLDANKKVGKEEEDDDKRTAPKETEDTENIKADRAMTVKEMEGNVFVFLLAGYDTTSTALGFSAYELALNPEVQEKLQREIDEHFPGQVIKTDYTSVHKMTYMDMFVSEVLRLHSVAQVASHRRADAPSQVGKYSVPAGMVFQIDHHTVHMNPDLWGPEDPQEFVPERFSKERKEARPSEAWVPFGVGPRNCIGMRFALLEIKMTLVQVLKKYTIQRCAETEVPIQTNIFGVKSPSNGVYVKLVAR